mmetsp:Transcript_9200/g.25801  ORF Transcript_9200/g.25801 Transcript_9200/m.25801 type:complete len:293 (-) Transcript_9200:361-1239(-)
MVDGQLARRAECLLEPALLVRSRVVVKDTHPLVLVTQAQSLVGPQRRLLLLAHHHGLSVLTRTQDYPRLFLPFFPDEPAGVVHVRLHALHDPRQRLWKAGILPQRDVVKLRFKVHVPQLPHRWPRYKRRVPQRPCHGRVVHAWDHQRVYSPGVLCQILPRVKAQDVWPLLQTVRVLCPRPRAPELCPQRLRRPLFANQLLRYHVLIPVHPQNPLGGFFLERFGETSPYVLLLQQLLPHHLRSPSHPRTRHHLQETPPRFKLLVTHTVPVRPIVHAYHELVDPHQPVVYQGME